MKANVYLSCLIISLFLGSCVNDTTNNDTVNAVTAPEKATTSNNSKLITAQNTKPSTPQAAPQAAPQASQNKKPVATDVAQQRPTENIKVTMPDGSQQKPQVKRQIKTPNPNNPNKASQQLQKTANKKLEKSLAHYGKLLPAACDLLTPEFVSEVIGGVDISQVVVKDGSGKNAVDAKACFFKWADKGNPNGGVLLQVQRNSIPDEFPDWASYYINGKVNQGDRTPDGSVTHRYKRWDGMGQAGAYSYDLARYTWRTESDHVFMVAFNLQSSEAEQLIWAEKLGNEAMKKFKVLDK